MGLTPAQHELVRRCMDVVETTSLCQDDTSNSESVVSCGEGPSNLDKGKGPDPHNWGGVTDIDPEELDVEAQCQAFLTFKHLQETANQPATPYYEEPVRTAPPPGLVAPEAARAPSLTYVRFQPQHRAEDLDVTMLREEITQLREQVTLLSLLQCTSNRAQAPMPQEQPVFSGPSALTAAQPVVSSAVSHTMMPSAQIDLTSRLGKLRGSAPAASNSAAAGGGGGDPSASASMAVSSRQPRVPILKLHEPEKYKGNAKVQAFQKFAQEATTYCVGYAIPLKEQVFSISSFLDGKAWEYYQYSTHDGSDNVGISSFLSGLFDYCFPLDFRQSMREQLQNTNQGNKSIKEFIHELSGLYIMIRLVPEQMKVQKL